MERNGWENKLLPAYNIMLTFTVLVNEIHYVCTIYTIHNPQFCSVIQYIFLSFLILILIVMSFHSLRTTPEPSDMKDLLFLLPFHPLKLIASKVLLIIIIMKTVFSRWVNSIYYIHRNGEWKVWSSNQSLYIFHD